MAQQAETDVKRSLPHGCVGDLFDAKTVLAQNGCTEWTGSFSKAGKAGYGLFIREGVRSYAHRFAYERSGRALLAGMSVLHACDNPKCVNPEHLFAGTQADNMKDMASKGRGTSAKGAANHKSRLTAADVIEIRNSSAPHAELGRKFGVSAQSVHSVRTGRTWSHVQ